jgi:hypothetical protein
LSKWLIAVFIIPLSLLTLRFEALYVWSRIEEKIGSRDYNESSECEPKTAAHRISDPESIALAVEQGIQNIEVDISIVENAVIVRHHPFELSEPHKLETYISEIEKPMTYPQFMESYRDHFDTVIFDIKNIYSSDENALELLRHPKLDKTKHIIIGRRCQLLKLIQTELDIPTGCESMGVIGNAVLGFKYWSVNYPTITHFQEWLLSHTHLKPMFWTFPNKLAPSKYCRMSPDWVLIEKSKVQN